jgi:aminoglycoside phosphotransferase (APT) family kinase protein
MSSCEESPEVAPVRANLTYLLRFGDRELVLRRPPFGPVGPGAHDMVREYKVLSKLWRYFDRAPRAFALCEDPAVIGATFFLMERRVGTVIRNHIPDEMAHHANVERRVSLALIDAMVDFHDIDYREAGFSDLGRPEGFVDRQLSGWHKRWEIAKDREVPELDRLHAWLVAEQPASPPATLVHNDFKLDNGQFAADNPDRIQSIFDWDMTTLGDPLIDLGTVLSYWIEAQAYDPEEVTVALMGQPGFPKPGELAEHYAAKRDVSVAAIAWYAAFALWKLAVVVQQIYIRWKRGQTTDERFSSFGERVPGLVALGFRAAAGDLG